MTNQHKFPEDKGLDKTLDILLKEGYEYILNKKEKLNTNVFETTLLGEQTICLSGEKAAKLFYDNDKFTRDGAMPKRILKTLFGETGVQTLDDSAHAHRKELFMPLLSEDTIVAFHKIAEKEWQIAIEEWQNQKKVVLYEETQEILTRIAAKWLGIPVEEKDYPELAKDLTNMFESAAKIGLQHHAGKKSRQTREKWLVDLVEKIRLEKVDVEEDKMLYDFAWHKDLNGEYLEAETVAVELLNILRPIVAISIYLNFVALALHDFPEEAKKVDKQDEKSLDNFVQEVRRYYPFFPFAGARVKTDFEWENYQFEKGTLTLLDLYGTNHDPEIWEDPDTFKAERFTTRQENKYDFIPQGGGDYLESHRCPGESVTIEMMKVALDTFINKIDYALPKQDFSYSMTEMPSMPKDKIILENVKVK